MPSKKKTMDLQVVKGDLFDADEKYFCHQCNCVTQKSAHLAYDVFKHYPWADIYSERPERFNPPNDGKPGNIVIRGNGEDERFVINLLGQYYPGSPRFPDSKQDGTKARETAFQQCLQKIAALPALDSVAFPFMIGCGAAGGDWIAYRHMIRLFAEKVDARVRVYQLR